MYMPYCMYLVRSAFWLARSLDTQMAHFSRYYSCIYMDGLHTESWPALLRPTR